MAANAVNVSAVRSRTPWEGIYSVTPEMARNWLANHNYQHQRKIRSYHVSSLARMMEQGRFRQKTQVNFVRLGSELFLTNGQHTLSAIEKSGIPQVLSVIVNEAESHEDVADDYARHDTHLTRQHVDSLVAHEMDKYFGVTPTQLQKMAAASIYYERVTSEPGSKGRVTQAQITHDEKLDLLKKHGDLALAALRLIEKNTTEVVRWAYRRSSMASIMFCLDKAPDIAEDFWSFVISDDGLVVGDPRKTLRRYMSSVVTSGAQESSKRAKQVATDHEIVKASSLCWNAFVDRRELKLIRVDYNATVAHFKRCGGLTP